MTDEFKDFAGNSLNSQYLLDFLRGQDGKFTQLHDNLEELDRLHAQVKEQKGLTDQIIKQCVSQLKERGWAVVPAVYDLQKARQMRDGFQELVKELHSAQLTPPIHAETDPERSYHTLGDFAATGRGMYTVGVSHAKQLWEGRLEHNLHKAFGYALYSDSELAKHHPNDAYGLVTSFDGMSYMPVPDNPLDISKREQEPLVKLGDLWLHMDKNPRALYKGHPAYGVEHANIYQGIANFEMSSRRDGGLLILEKSHKYHIDEFPTVRHWKESRMRGDEENHARFDCKQIVDKYIKTHQCRLIKICLRPGDLVLWGSQTIHSNLPGRGGNVRAAQYITLGRKDWMTDADRDKKLDLFNKALGTSHWPHLNIAPFVTKVTEEPFATIEAHPKIKQQLTLGLKFKADDSTLKHNLIYKMSGGR